MFLINFHQTLSFLEVIHLYLTFDILLCHDVFVDRIIAYILQFTLISLLLGYFASLLFNKYFSYHSMSNLIFQYLRAIKYNDYDRNQNKKIWPTIFSLKGNIYGRKNSVGHGCMLLRPIWESTTTLYMDYTISSNN